MKTDVRETEDGYEVDIDLPGFKKDDISASACRMVTLPLLLAKVSIRDEAGKRRHLHPQRAL